MLIAYLLARSLAHLPFSTKPSKSPKLSRIESTCQNFRISSHIERRVLSAHKLFIPRILDNALEDPLAEEGFMF